MKPGSSPAGRELLVTKADTICAVSSASFVSVSLSAAILSDMYSSNRFTQGRDIACSQGHATAAALLDRDWMEIWDSKKSCQHMTSDVRWKEVELKNRRTEEQTSELQ